MSRVYKDNNWGNLCHENWVREPNWGALVTQSLLVSAFLFVVMWMLYFKCWAVFWTSLLQSPSSLCILIRMPQTPHHMGLIKWPLPSLVVLAGDAILNELAANETDPSLSTGLAKHKPRCGCTLGLLCEACLGWRVDKILSVALESLF